MENKYILERKTLYVKLNELNYEINKLSKLLNQLEKYFDKKESLEALKRIHKYLEDIKLKQQNLETDLKKNQQKILTSCSHEILIKTENSWYACPICFQRISQNKINFKCILVEADENLDISSIIYEISKKNEPIIDNFEKYIENKNVRIYRR